MSVKGQLSIPRIELAAAKTLAERVLEVEEQLDLPDRRPTIYYSDSQDVLDWIKNATTKEPLKRYVVSRITFIRRVSKPEQWHYIKTGINLADLGTRPISVKDLQASSWLSGPTFLSREDPTPPEMPTPQLPSASFFTHASSYFTIVSRGSQPPPFPDFSPPFSQVPFLQKNFQMPPF